LRDSLPDRSLMDYDNMMHDTPKYDVSNTMFSPEGRLFQVEYAREAIKKGSTVLAMKYKHGVLFLTRRAKDTHIVVESSAKKLYRISENIVGASSGLVADARALIDFCRYISTRTKLRYDEPITIETLVKRLGNVLRTYTQYGGVRPFGVALLVGGIDSTGIKLYETDISGAIRGYKAVAIGMSTPEVIEILEERYHLVDNKDEAFKELYSMLKEVQPTETEGTMLEVMCVDEKKGFSFDRITDVKSL